MTFSRLSGRLLCACLLVGLATSGLAQQGVDTTPSRKTLEDAAGEGCDGVSSVVRRCADQAKEAAAREAEKKSDDALVQSRAKTKAAFDRRDQRARDQALRGDPSSNPASSALPSVGAERLGGVEVTGKDEKDVDVEGIIQKALSPPPAKSNGNGTTSRYAPNGTRYDCIEKCYGPACCAEIRSMPDPARNSNSIVGH